MKERERIPDESPHEKMDHRDDRRSDTVRNHRLWAEEAFAVLIIFASLVGMEEYNRMAFGAVFPWEKVETLIIALFILLTAFAGDSSCCWLS